MLESPFSQVMVALIVATAAGAVIGMEREQAKGTKTLGGVRTFALFCLAGALSGLLALAVGVWVAAAAVLVAGALLVSGHLRAPETTGHGMTTELAALMTFFLGMLTTVPVGNLSQGERLLMVAAVAGGTMAILSVKEPLHEIVQRLSSDDIYATAKFVILTLVVLPLLPNEAMGPYDAWNPFHIGVLVVLIAAISFLGYLATRFIGATRALLMTGIAGGVASSTAVTVSLSQRVRENGAMLWPAITAITAAAVMMFVRIGAIIAAVDRPLLKNLALPLEVMGGASAAIAAVLYFLRRDEAADGASVTFKNPFALRPALMFGLAFAVILLASHAASEKLGSGGVYASAALAGLVDLDAISLSIVSLHHGGLDAEVAARGIAIAAMVNTAVKALIAMWMGGRALGLRLALVTLSIVAAGALILLVS
jgi:uncharacterized membrane protein (DUF4010 family)